MLVEVKTEDAEILGKTVTKSFDIGDPAIIIQFMSKTIYSNPLRVAVQEYCTNARDAHIEAGIGSTPITIICPNRFDPTLKICDNGPGISPDRMHNVFVRYGISTKRTDNAQSGGFGLGAKSFWAYTSTFNIVTTAYEKNQLVRRHYSAIMEKGKAPRLVEFGDPIIIDINDPEIPESDKKTGTVISASIKPEDFERCKNYIIDVTKFWNVRPVIDGCNPIPEYPNFKWAYEGSNWKIGYERNSYEANCFVCIDGIPYPLNRGAISDFAEAANVYEICRTNFVLFFNVGELSVSLSRESLQYDEETKLKIVERLKEMKDWLNKNLQKQVETAKSLWDASILYKKLSSVFATNSIVGDVFWNGIKVTGEKLYCEQGTCRRYYNDSVLAGVTKIKSKKDYSIDVDDNSVFAICDDEKIFVGKIATLLDQNPNKIIYVYNPSGISPTDKQASLDKFKAKVPGFDHYNPIYLSTVVKKKMPRPVNTSNKPRSPKYSMKETEIITADGFEYDDEINYMNDSGYYVVSFRHSVDSPYFHTTKQISDFLSKFAPDETVYLINSRYSEKIKKNPKFISIAELVKKVYNDEIGNYDVKKYYEKINASRFTVDYKMSDDRFKTLIMSHLDKLDGTIFRKWIEISSKIEESKTDADLELLLKIGRNLNDSRTLDSARQDADPIMQKYATIYDENMRTLQYFFRDCYYWEDIDVKIKQIAIDAFLMAVNKLFIDK